MSSSSARGRRGAVGAVVRAYLVAYNCAQALGWARVLWDAIEGIRRGGSAYETSRDTLVMFQLASVMEVAHAISGLTPSPAGAAAAQWAGRTHCLLCALDAVKSNRSSLASTILVLAWALTEIIRYPSYVGALVGACPSWLTWLRYTVFVPLYPLGAGAEMKLMYDAREHARRTKMFAITMPNAFNFAFDYPTFLNVLLVAYPFLFYSLYAYMFVQRRKKLGSTKAKQN